MKVKEVMTTGELSHCSIETKLHEAAKIMRDTNRGALPVLDKDKKVIGILTDRDVALTLASKKEKAISELKVKDAIANLKIHSVKAEDTVSKALQQMRKNKIGRLPITDKEGKLKGMLSINNLLLHSIENKEELGHLTSSDENLAKTIKTLFERNNSQEKRKEVKEKELVES